MSVFTIEMVNIDRPVIIVGTACAETSYAYSVLGKSCMPQFTGINEGLTTDYLLNIPRSTAVGSSQWFYYGDIIGWYSNELPILFSLYPNPDIVDPPWIETGPQAELILSPLTPIPSSLLLFGSVILLLMAVMAIRKRKSPLSN
jgi:hypothetical protein